MDQIIVLGLVGLAIAFVSFLVVRGTYALAISVKSTSKPENKSLAIFLIVSAIIAGYCVMAAVIEPVVGGVCLLASGIAIARRHPVVSAQLRAEYDESVAIKEQRSRSKQTL